MLERYLGSRKAIYPLMVLTIIAYGLLDALTTVICFHIVSGHGYNALNSEISPLIRSGIFGADWRAVILSKVFIMAVIFLHLYILSQYQQLVPIVNACLLMMTICGTIAAMNNINIILGGDDIAVFNISPLVISAILSTLILLLGFDLFLMRLRDKANDTVN